MKIYTLLLLLTPAIALSQTLKENKKDEFTGKQIKETSVEKLAYPFKMSGLGYNFSVQRVNDIYYFNVRMMSLDGSVFSVFKDSEFMLKLKNDSIITLLSPTDEISIRGGAGPGLSASASQGVSVYYPISRDKIDAILASEIVKIRVYTSNGYTEQEIKEGGSKKVKKAFNLVLW